MQTLLLFFNIYVQFFYVCQKSYINLLGELLCQSNESHYCISYYIILHDNRLIGSLIFYDNLYTFNRRVFITRQKYTLKHRCWHSKKIKKALKMNYSSFLCYT